jgi:preprotein translocase, YajC subunit
MFVSPAFAQTGSASGEPGVIAFLPIVLIMAVFYFLMIRPQQKKMREHREMLAAIRRGDRIVTGGGIIGTVSKVVDDNELQVEIAEGVRVRVQRTMISSVLTKPEPAAGKPVAGNGDKLEKSPANDTDGGATTPAAPSAGSPFKRLFGGKREQ